MDIKKIVFIIAGIDVVLLGVCLFLYLGKDRTVPVISFGESPVVYEEGMDVAPLLEGVTAIDAVDGDVSSSLLVEKIAGTNGKEVIVTYVARDSANNVGKAFRAFPVTEKNKNVQETEGGELKKEESMPEDESTETGSEEKEESSPAVSEDTGEEEGANEEEKPAEKREESQAEPTPVLEISADTIETKIGTAPNWNHVIRKMTDDKDDYNTLFNNLKMEGNVNLNEAGDYPVMLYTVDSDGNRSETFSLMVRVEASE